MVSHPDDVVTFIKSSGERRAESNAVPMQRRRQDEETVDAERAPVGALSCGSGDAV
jgi:hypothetical protein